MNTLTDDWMDGWGDGWRDGTNLAAAPGLFTCGLQDQQIKSHLFECPFCLAEQQDFPFLNSLYPSSLPPSSPPGPPPQLL